METKRILRPVALPAAPCAASVGGSNSVAFIAAPAIAAPAPKRTKLRRVIEGIFIGSLLLRSLAFAIVSPHPDRCPLAFYFPNETPSNR
jgi:hypothetical protein